VGGKGAGGDLRTIESKSNMEIGSLGPNPKRELKGGPVFERSFSQKGRKPLSRGEDIGVGF